MGLLTVAAMMPKSWEKRLIDMATTTLRDQDIRWADYVFISAMFVQRKSVRQVIDKCKNLGTKVVAGGPLFTSVPEYYLDADHLVLNEAEITLPLFLSDLEKGDAERMYRTRKQADMSETPSQEGLDECNKVQNKGRDMVACIKKIQAAGIEVQGGFILGFDSDTTAILENLTRFIQQSGVVTAMIGLLNAPGRYYDRVMIYTAITFARPLPLEAAILGTISVSELGGLSAHAGRTTNRL